jgi:hypothetical protein
MALPRRNTGERRVAPARTSRRHTRTNRHRPARVAHPSVRPRMPRRGLPLRPRPSSCRRRSPASRNRRCSIRSRRRYRTPSRSIRTPQRLSTRARGRKPALSTQLLSRACPCALPSPAVCDLLKPRRESRRSNCTCRRGTRSRCWSRTRSPPLPHPLTCRHPRRFPHLCRRPRSVRWLAFEGDPTLPASARGRRGHPEQAPASDLQ